jgi:hypothetical protein
VGEGSRFHFTIRLTVAKEDLLPNQQREFRLEGLTI